MKVPVEPRPAVYKPAEKPTVGGRTGSAPWASKRMSGKSGDAKTSTDARQRTAWKMAKTSGSIYENNSRRFSEVVERGKEADPRLQTGVSGGCLAFYRLLHIIKGISSMEWHSIA
jgi:hypothetical protein